MGGDQLVAALGGDEVEQRIGEEACERWDAGDRGPLRGLRDDELRDAGALAIYDTPGDVAAGLDETDLA